MFLEHRGTASAESTPAGTTGATPRASRTHSHSTSSPTVVAEGTETIGQSHDDIPSEGVGPTLCHHVVGVADTYASGLVEQVVSPESHSHTILEQKLLNVKVDTQRGLNISGIINVPIVGSVALEGETAGQGPVN